MEKGKADTIQVIFKYIEDGSYETALQLILQHKRLGVETVDFLKAQALLCIEVGEYNTAISILKKAEKMSPLEGDVYYYLTRAYEGMQKKHVVGKDNIIIVNTDSNNNVVFDDDLNLYKIRQNSVEGKMMNDDPYVSIVLTGYNNLDRLTKPAVESLLENTQGIDYELILIDNGSKDGTFEYFKSVPFAKKKVYRITKNLGGLFGYNAAKNACGGRFTRGKFVVSAPNDVIFTPNWLTNMLRCAESDEKIGVVVPVFDNCSNFQTGDLKYTDIADLQRKTVLYNQSDTKKWEERLRIIPVLWLRRQELVDLFDGDNAFIHNFADDDLSCQYRRAGYKLMVCKDVFMHHEGSSIIGKDVVAYNNDLEKGRKIYRKKYYGLDAWDDICNFEKAIMDLLPISAKNSSAIRCLGVDVRCGTPILELKNKLHANGIDAKWLGSAFCTDAKYWLDLKTICTGEVVCDRSEFFQQHFQMQFFDYIVLGEYINIYKNSQGFLRHLCNKLNTNGVLALKCKNSYDIYGLKELSEQNIVLRQRMIDIILGLLPKLNCKLLKMALVEYSLTGDEKESLRKQVSVEIVSRETSDVLKDLFVREYVLIIGRL